VSCGPNELGSHKRQIKRDSAPWKVSNEWAKLIDRGGRERGGRGGGGREGRGRRRRRRRRRRTRTVRAPNF